MLLKQSDHKISSFFPTFLVTYLKLSYHNLIIVISTRPNAKKKKNPKCNSQGDYCCQCLKTISCFCDFRSTETPPWPLWKCMNSTPPTAWRWRRARRQALAWSAHGPGCLCQRTVSYRLISSSRNSRIGPT